MIQKEKQRMLNSTMVHQRKKRQQRLEEEAAEATILSQKRAREEIETLKEALHKQKIDADAAKSRHRLNEKRWKDMVTERDQKIKILNEDIGSLEDRIIKLEEQKDELVRRRDKEVSARKKDMKKRKAAKGQKGHERPADEDNVLHTHDDTRGAFDEVEGSALREVESSTVKGDPKTKTGSTTNEGQCILRLAKGTPTNREKEKQDNDNDRHVEADIDRAVGSNLDLIQGPAENW